MKKIFLSIAILSSATFAMAQSKSDVKAKLVTRCETEFKSKMASMPNVTSADITNFCSCNADKLLAKFTAEEVAKMEATMAGGSAAEKKDVSQKISPIIMPCFADLQAKMTK